MKKSVCMILALAMILPFGTVTVLATEMTAPGSANTIVSCTVEEPSYTVTIPATATLDTEFEIKAENVANVPTGKQLAVRVTDWTRDPAGGDAAFNLKSGAAYIPCLVTRGRDSDSAYALTGSGNLVLAVVAGRSSGSGKMYIKKTNEAGVYAPGTYAGSMTFTIAIETAG